MSVQIFTQLFFKIDTVSVKFVSEIAQRSIIAVTPIVSIGLTLAFIIYGMLIIRGIIAAPVTEFLGKSLRIGVITSIALTGGLYQTQIANMIYSLPDELVSALIPNSSEGAACIIDKTAEIGFKKSSEAFAYAGFLTKDGVVYAIFGLIILLTTSILVAIGGAILLLTKLALAILVGLGPFFIIALLWQPTMRFFEMWTAQVVNYILLVVLFSAAFGLMVTIFGSYMEDMRFDGVQNLSYALGGSIILSIAMIMIILQLPKIASGLAGGVSLGFISELSKATSLSDIYSSNATYLLSKQIAHASAKGNISNNSSAKGAENASAGYFRGSFGKTNSKR